MEEGQEILDKRYKVIKKLGGGAFGELYKVEKRKTGDFLAAKVEKAVKNAKHIMLFCLFSWGGQIIVPKPLHTATKVEAIIYI